MEITAYDSTRNDGAYFFYGDIFFSSILLSLLVLFYLVKSDLITDEKQDVREIRGKEKKKSTTEMLHMQNFSACSIDASSSLSEEDL